MPVTEVVDFWLILSPTEILPVGVPLNFIAYREENWLSVNVLVDPYVSGLFKIPIWANLVSIGKSFVESSNLEYAKILSVPSSLYKSYPWPFDGGIIGISLAAEDAVWLIDPRSTIP